MASGKGLQRAGGVNGVPLRGKSAEVCGLVGVLAAGQKADFTVAVEGGSGLLNSA
jgi:hypothetical protein